MTRESRLRRIAFGDPGEPAAAARHPAVAVQEHARSDRERWLAAVVLGARGHYAAATTLLRPLRHSRDPVIASLAASTTASHRRQLGGHAAAMPADGAALAAVADVSFDGASRVPAGRYCTGGRGAGGGDTAGRDVDTDGVDTAGAWADALLGLAADHLALGRPALARRLVGDVTDRLDVAFGVGGGSRRSRVRAGWVGAEAALAGGDPAGAVASAEAVLALVGSPSEVTPVRHRAKTELVLAAALLASGTDSLRPAALVASALTAIDTHGFASLSWPARLLAAETDPARADEHRRRATSEVHALLPRADPELRRLAVGSPWVPV